MGSGATVTLSGCSERHDHGRLVSGNYRFESLPSGPYANSSQQECSQLHPTQFASDSGGNRPHRSELHGRRRLRIRLAFSGTISPAANGAGVTVTLGGRNQLRDYDKWFR